MDVFSYSAKVIISIALCCISVVLFLLFKQKERMMCMFAMILSACGIILLKNPMDASLSNIITPMLFTMLSNITYGFCFYNACRRKKYHYFSQYFNVGVFITAACIIILVSLMLVFSSASYLVIPTIAFFLCLGFNVSSQFAYGYNEDGERFLLVGAALMLLLTDFLKFLPALEIARISENLATIIYTIAQLLIIIFNSDLKKDAM